MRLKFRTRLVCRCAALVGIAALGSIYVVLGGEFLGSGHAGGAAVPATTGSAGDGASRQLLEVDPLFPTALQGSDKVLLAVYIPLIMYMFLALAIICDEYFVPALEVICDEENLNLTDDVAGATFMAAGGSAPELFTSFIGTFKRSAVGFGTIVGSAVFNVLFVIAMCAFFSKDLLRLTWWPLARDSTYYSFSLIVLAVFFGYVTPNEIEVWEACVLFAMYFGYVALMMYNEALYAYLGFANDDDEGVKTEMINGKEVRVHPANLRSFRAGILGIVARGGTLHERAAADHVINKIEGTAEETFHKLAQRHSTVEGAEPTINPDDLRVLFKEMEIETTDAQLEEFLKELDTNGNGEICWNEFKTWYNKSEDRVRQEMQSAFNKISAVSIDSDPNHIDGEGLRKVLKEIGGLGDMSEEEFETTVEEAQTTMDINNDGLISRDEFTKWYETSEFWELKNQCIGVAPTTPTTTPGEGEGEGEGKGEEEDDEPDPLVFPSDGDCQTIAFWIIAAPLVFLFAYTLPNPQKDPDGYNCFGIQNKKTAWLGFFGSIVWIGFASFGMVEWATIVGDTFGIPAQVMGLTFLAAGTSVPDLLSSVVVAQQGKGDMAVSSSIGSNIFDVLVGLPLPWLVFALIEGESVKVGAKSLELSIIILLGMLIFVIIAIKCCDWALTTELGIAMVMMYVAFICQDLLRDQTLICTGGCF